MLTKISSDLLLGNGSPNMLVIDAGSSLDVSSLPAIPGVTVNAISYDRQAGVMTIVLSNGENMMIKGFVRASDMRKGSDGDPGKTGLNGANGINGNDGPTGPTGPIGYKGITGIQGLPGPKGATGPIGLMGYSGKGGDQGLQGPQGKLGPQGKKGPQGDAGRKGFLNIVVSDGDPGAIGAGSMWVKSGGFVYGSDKVNFTVTGSIQDILCQDTLNLLSIVDSGNPIPDWWTSKDLNNSAFTTHVAAYKSSALKNNIVVVADFETVNGIQTCIVDKTIASLGLKLDCPVCCTDGSVVYLLDSNILYAVDGQSIKTYNLNVLANDILFYQNTLYISSSNGLYTFDFVKLNKLNSFNILYTIVYADLFYLVTETFTIETDLKNRQSQLNGRAIVSSTDNTLVMIDTSNGITVSTTDNKLLWHNPNFIFYKDNLVRVGNSYYTISTTGPRFVVDSSYNVVVDENWIIEYTNDYIHITENM